MGEGCLESPRSPDFVSKPLYTFWKAHFDFDYVSLYNGDVNGGCELAPRTCELAPMCGCERGGGCKAVGRMGERDGMGDGDREREKAGGWIYWACSTEHCGESGVCCYIHSPHTHH